MNRAEAYAVLGLEGPTDAKSARRAYLRAVKRHKPERDPDGFQRVRAAYEAVQADLKVGRSPPRRSRPVPVAPTNPPQSMDVPAEEAPNDAPVAEPNDPPIELEDSPFQGVPDPLPLEPLASPYLRSWTVEPIVDEPFIEPAAQLQMAADAAELEAELAVELLQQALQTHVRMPQFDVNPLDALVPVLLLHRAGHAKLAKQAWAHIQSWVDDMGFGVRMPQSISARMLLTRELSELPSYFPADVRRRIATAILDNDLPSAQPDLLDFGRVQQIRARDAAELLQEHAPNLSGVFRQPLLTGTTESAQAEADDDEPEIEAPRLGPTWVLWVLLVMLIFSLGWCNGPAKEPRGPSSLAPPAFLAETYLCGRFPDDCALIAGLAHSAMTEDCDGVSANLPALRTRVAADADPTSQGWLDTFVIRLQSDCPEVQ